MRKCSTCQQQKPETEFYKKGESGRLHSLCKEYFNEYCWKRWPDRKILVMGYSVDTVSSRDIRAGQQLFLIWYPQVGQVSSKAHL